MRINSKKILATLVAATTVFSSVAPSYVYGAEGTTAAEAVETAPEEEPVTVQAEEEPADESPGASVQKEQETEEADSAEEQKSELSEETEPADDNAGASAETPAPVKEEESEEGTTSAQEKEEEKKETAEEGTSGTEDPSEEKEEGTVSDEKEETEESAAAEDTEQKEPSSGKEPETEKVHFRLHFDDGAKTVKVIVSSDEGADEDDPSVTIEKKEDGSYETKARSQAVEDMLVIHEDEKDLLDLECVRGESISIVNETAEGYKASEYSITIDGGAKETLDFDAQAEKFRYELILDEKDVLFEIVTAKEETEAAAEEKPVEKPAKKQDEKNGSFGLKLASAGGAVTVETEDKDGAKASYEVTVGKDGKAVVKGDEAEGRDGYALALDLQEGAKVTVTARADKDATVNGFTVTGADGKEKKVALESIVDRKTGISRGCAVASETVTVSKGMTIAEISFDEMPEFDAEEKAGDVTVKIHADKGILPSGTKVVVREMTDEEAQEYYNKVRAMSDVMGLPVAAVDITFLDKDKKEIQPAGKVDVTFTQKESYEDLTIYHAKDGKTEKMEEIKGEATDSSVSIESSSFSPFIIYSASEPNWTAGGKGKRSTLSNAKAYMVDVPFADKWFNYGTYGRDYGSGCTTVRYDTQITGKDNDGKKIVGETTMGTCVNPDLADVDGKMSGGKCQAVSVLEVTTPMLIKAVYYGNNGPGSSYCESIYKASHGGTSNEGGQEVLTHVAIAAIYCQCFSSKTGMGYCFNDKTTAKLQQDVYKFVDGLVSKSVPSNFRVFVAHFSEPDVQDFMLGSEMEETTIDTGKLRIYKKTNESITETAPFDKYYNVGGATFTVTGISGDAVGTTKTLKSKASGYTNWVKVPTGKYRIVETKAPDGYTIAVESKTITITKGEEQTENFNDTPHKIKISFSKTSANATVTASNPNYSLAGAVYGLYTDAACTTLLKTDWVNPNSRPSANKFTVAANGTANTITNLPYCKYYVKEITAPKGFKPDTKIYTLDCTEGQNGNLVVSEEPQYGQMDVQKVSGNTAITTGNASYSFAGAEFTVYSNAGCTTLAKIYSNAACTAAIAGSKLTTNANGKTQVAYLPLGSYWVKETKAPTGFALNSTPKAVTVTSSNYATAQHVEITDNPISGSIDIQKKSDNEAITSTTAGYSLSGAEFTVYSNAACTTLAKIYSNAACTTAVAGSKLTTNANGKTTTVYGPLGQYWVKETKAPAGFKLNSTPVGPYSITTANYSTTQHAEVTNKPMTGRFIIQKKSANSRITDNNACYSFKDAEFLVYSDAACKTLAKIYSDEDCKNPIAGSRLTTGADGKTPTAYVPFGKYWFREVKPPKGYQLDPVIFGPYECTAENYSTVAQFNVNNTPLSDPLEIVLDKTNRNAKAGEMVNSLAGAQFTVDYYDGYYTADEIPDAHTRRWVLETKPHDGKFKAVFETDMIDSLSDEPYRDSNGEICLPLGTITIRETKAPAGYVNDGEFGEGIDTYIMQVRALTGNVGAVVAVIQGTSREVNNTYVGFDILETPIIPTIGTKAKDKDSNVRVSMAGGEVTVVDTVSYKNLVAGQEYVMKGELVDKVTGTVIKDAEGNEVKAETTFTGSDTLSGTVDVTFTFKADETFRNKSIVAFEYVYRDGEELVAKDREGRETKIRHTDLTDEGQTIHFPEIKTSVLDDASGSKNVLAKGEQTVTDTVSYENLVPGIQYEATGVLMDKATGNPILVNGNEVHGSTKFTPDSAEGTVDVKFSFDATGLDGKQLVSFEELHVAANGWVVGEHKEITDLEQTAPIIKVTTNAADSKTHEKNSLSAEKQTVVDDISFENMIAGREYRITGELKVIPENGQGTFDAAQTVPSKVTGARSEYGQVTFDEEGVTFVPSGTAGSAVTGMITIDFEFDATPLAGKTIVVGETVATNGKPVAIHRELEDKDQFDLIPDGRTTAIDTKTGIKNVLSEEKSLIVDTFHYKNLLPGKTYIITGEVMLKPDEEGTEESVSAVMTDKDGNPVENGCFVLVPEEGEGDIDLYFLVDTRNLKNKDLVVYERVSLNGSPVIIHEDIKDQAQTTYVPEGSTTAIDSETEDRLSLADEEVTIIDRFVYKNLIPGTEYTITGRVMHKADVTEVPADITGAACAEGTSATVSFDKDTVTFTPDTKDGSLDIRFTFDGSQLMGEDVVVFERAFYNNVPVIIHENIDDLGQTVQIGDGHTTAGDVDTDSRTMMAKEDTIIKDVFYYENLLPGKEYSMTGKVMLKPEGEEEAVELPAQMVDAEGNPIEAWTFTAEDKNGSETLYFKVDASQLADRSAVLFERVKYKGVDVVIHEDITDENQTIHFPDGGTTATDSDTEIHISLADEEVTILDEVMYRNLIPGDTYTLHGILMDKETGEPVTVNGKEVTGQETFTAQTEDGSVIVKFTFDATALENRTVVAFETMKSMGKDVFIHARIDDEAQTVHIPEGRTTAVDSETKDKLSLADKEVTIIDRFVFKNLIPGTEYTLTGRVIKKSDEEEVPAKITGAEFAVEETTPEEDVAPTEGQTPDEGQTPAEGTTPDEGTTPAEGTEPGQENANTAEEGKISYTGEVITFTPATADGSIDLKLTFDGSELEDEDVVVFENAYYNEVPVIVHENITDDAQTVHIAKGRTFAHDSETGSRTMMAQETVTIQDDLHYSNLIPGGEYTVTGKVMLKPDANGKAEELQAQMVDKDGNPEEAHTFTAEKKDGIEPIFFVINAADLAGRSTVVFERVEYNDVDVIVHEDINDEDETIHFPDGGTTAVDSETEDHISVAGEKVTILDEVRFKNLIPGKQYTVYGTLMDKETGDPITVKGKEVTGKETFAAQDANGSVIVEFTFDASELAGKNLVAFETMQSNGKDVFVHAKIDDEDQTIHIPDGGTTATDSETQEHTSSADKKVTILDEVTYENLLPGKTYTVNGVLVDKATGNPITVNGKEVTGSKTFTAQEANGSMTVKFTFNGSEMAGKSVVAFETMQYKGKDVFVHKDLKDEEQTIDFPSVKTSVKNKNGGGRTVKAEGTAAIVDTVSYTNLAPGERYVITGVLMDKSTKREAKAGGKTITGETSFMANKSNGTEDVEFTFDASGLKAGDYVVFEELYAVSTVSGKRVLVGSHKDIDDQSQTITVTTTASATSKTSGGKAGSNPKTGDNSPFLPWLGAAAASAIGIGIIVAVRRRKTGTEQ